MVRSHHFRVECASLICIDNDRGIFRGRLSLQLLVVPRLDVRSREGATRA